MAVNICFYEDSKYRDFFPLTLTRPIFLLRAGIEPLFKRALRFLPDASISLSPRTQLNGVTSIVQSDFPVNILKSEDKDMLLLNSRVRDYGDLQKIVEESRLSMEITSSGETVGYLLKNEFLLKKLRAVFTLADVVEELKADKDELTEFHTSATLYSNLWELVNDIQKEINADYEHLMKTQPTASNLKISEGANFIKEDNIYLGNNVEIGPATVIDATFGPVYIDDNCKIEPHAAIYGPFYLGENSVVSAGQYTSCSIGSTCKIGGEIEESIFQNHVNKHHDGFIGHSYVGSWVNFGAMTTNSDLKNNYSNIKVSLNGQMIDTGSNKIGSFIGDHTKFGIGTLLNTGINIGACCNIFGGSLVADKEVGSFNWGTTGSFQPYQIDKAIETAEAVCQRRGVTLSDYEKTLLKEISENNISDEGIVDL